MNAYSSEFSVFYEEGFNMKNLKAKFNKAFELYGVRFLALFVALTMLSSSTVFALDGTYAGGAIGRR